MEVERMRYTELQMQGKKLEREHASSVRRFLWAEALYEKSNHPVDREIRDRIQEGQQRIFAEMQEVVRELNDLSVKGEGGCNGFFDCDM
jgi:hypothetical protein